MNELDALKIVQFSDSFSILIIKSANIVIGLQLNFNLGRKCKINVTLIN